MLDGDEWVINGQKVWTTQAQFADYCFLLARTDPDAPKHAGISYLLVPMQQPGVEVRPITQPDGTAEFNEVFFADARCPEDNVVGGLNNGWAVTNTTLGFERGQSATTGLPPLPGGVADRWSPRPRANGAIDDPIIRQRLAALLHEGPDHPHQRPAHAHRHGAPAARTRRSPRSAPPTRCSGRRCTSEAMELALDIFGAEAMLADCRPRVRARGPARAAAARARAGYPVSPMLSAFFFSRSETIWGGTSQIQRNIVGERVLGLPKEPKVEGKRQGLSPCG